MPSTQIQVPFLEDEKEKYEGSSGDAYSHFGASTFEV